jgi:3,4-dihydroxy 2-butanone 4-phosphate synthase/GTP cyclohydrolase II
MHTTSTFADVFGERSDRFGLLRRSMEAIAAEGAGVIVVINRPMHNWLSRVIAARARGGPIEEQPEFMELRDYGVGAQILAEMGIEQMILLTNSHHSPVALSGYGLTIVAKQPIPAGRDEA